MDFEQSEEHQMLQQLVARFVADELLPLEPALLERESRGQGAYLNDEETARLDARSSELGLWGLDAPQDVGGSDLPLLAMVGVNEEMGKACADYHLPPDSPNLRMLAATVNDDQRERYLAPYVSEGTVSAIGISEPGAGADPSAMQTRAVRDGEGWLINGRKIWVTRAAAADFTILMAVTDPDKGARGGITAFLVDKDTPGFNVVRPIPMIGGHITYEIELEDMRLSDAQVLGEVGKGFAPMQLRLTTRRLQMATWCIGMAQRALDMMCEYADQRVTFGKPLAERQTIQNWAADAAMGIHACRLMVQHAAWKSDQGKSVRTEISMAKVQATELAWQVIDHAMQAFGAMGMTKEMPLQLMAAQVRNMRIYDGPSEVHRWVVARSLMNAGR